MIKNEDLKSFPYFWNVLYFAIIFFCISIIVTIPFPYQLIPSSAEWFLKFFESLVYFSGTYLFKLPIHFSSLIVSDSLGMYLHFFNVAVLSLLLAALFVLFNKRKINYAKITYWFQTLISYYLALQLFRYGFDKVFKAQFYLPEPNILFTPLGQLTPDILYWSSMGVSHSYSVFSGLIEILPAILLLFKRSRVAGAMLAFMVLLNVWMINIGFDISVKIYASFLLLLSFILSKNGFIQLWQLLVNKQAIIKTTFTPKFDNKNKVLFYSLIKSVVITLVLLEGLYPFIITSNFNDDIAPRPYLNGAYEVELAILNNDTMPKAAYHSSDIKRFFIHREGYLITQQMNDEMKDYRLKIDSNRHILELKSSAEKSFQISYNYQAADSILALKADFGNGLKSYVAKQINTNKLPVFKQGFNWTVNGGY